MPYTRLTRLIQELKKHNLEAFLINSPVNIFYLTGFKAEDSVLLATPKKYFFITDARFKEECQKIFLPDKNRVEIKIESVKKSKWVIIKEIISGLGLRKVGFEAKDLSFFNYQKLKFNLAKQTRLAAVPDLVETLRSIKDKDEIRLMAQAARITKAAFLYLNKIIKPGQKAINLVREIEHFIRQEGGQGTAFDLIIAPGKESSKPHALVSKQTIKKNQSVLVDIGVNFKGYNSDLTRTFFLGRIPSNLKEIKEIVIEAQKRVIKTIRGGVEICLLDKIARDYITNRGYGNNFLHSLGHGIGLQVHENPAVNGANRQKLEEGMVFTIEPAIYIPGYGGVRVEDMVLVTDKGCRVLSDDLDQSI